jgi:hypothetical protein
MFLTGKQEIKNSHMTIKFNNSSHIVPIQDSSVKLKKFSGGVRIKRLTKRYRIKKNKKAKLVKLIKYVISLIVIVTIFSCKPTIISTAQNQNPIIGKWIWRESIHVDNKSNFSTPKSIGYQKSIFFTKDRNVIIYKNDVEIRISKYELSKGISIFDQKEHDLIIFEGATYVIEELDNKNLILARNYSDGYRSRFYR